MLELYQNINNETVNKYWEGNLPRDFVKPNESTSNSVLWTFINSKYAKKKYATNGIPDPASEFVMRKNGTSIENNAEKKEECEKHDQPEVTESIPKPENPKSTPFSEILIDINSFSKESKASTIEPKPLLISNIYDTPLLPQTVKKEDLYPSVGLNLDTLKNMYSSSNKAIESKFQSAFTYAEMEPVSTENYIYFNNGNYKKSAPNAIKSKQISHKKEEAKKEKKQLDVNELVNNIAPKKVISKNANSCFDDIPMPW